MTHYNVPDAINGTWIKSRPKAHAAAIEAKSTECGFNFRRIIKMVKWWSSIHSDYLQGYHTEVLALCVLSGNLDDTPWNVFQFFEKTRPLLVSALWHDLGFVDDYLSYDDRQQVLKRFDTAIEKSRTAWHLTYGTNSDHEAAIGLWKQVFGDKFPSYG